MRTPLVITGASGFVGRRLAALCGADAKALSMRQPDWTHHARAMTFEGATVVHLAGRVHESHGEESAFMRDNAAKTGELAQLAARRGARRFVYLSSVKVNGEETRAVPFTRADPPAPRDAYARSKLSAEDVLWKAAAAEKLEACVVRAPLVYGSGAGGNLAALLRLADTPWPLPFASLDNRRSFIHVDDLCALLLECTRAPSAAGKMYFAAHETPASTRDLTRLLRRALGRPARLFRIPGRVLEAAAAMAGGSERIRRLTRSLEVDPRDAKAELGWHARCDLEACVRALAARQDAQAT